MGTQSDPYPCPYDTSSTYVDLRGVFSHCVGSNTAATLPSITAATIPVYGDSIIQLSNKIDSAGRFHLPDIVSGIELTFTLRFRHPTKALPFGYDINILAEDPTGPTWGAPIAVVTGETIVES